MAIRAADVENDSKRRRPSTVRSGKLGKLRTSSVHKVGTSYRKESSMGEESPSAILPEGPIVMLQPSLCSGPMSSMSKSVMIVSAVMSSGLSVSLVR